MSSLYDAILVVSFGGPEGPDDVIPFLENVTRGKRVPRERLLEVAEHYHHFGGRSPINDQTALLVEALRAELAASGPNLPVYLGNRNWRPMLADAVRQMAADGIRRALAFVTSAWSSYSSCRQYLENITAARAEAGPDAPIIDKLRIYGVEPGFIEAMADRVRTAMEKAPGAEILYTAHSIPMSMAATCRYEQQLRDASAAVSRLAGASRWRLVYQSRSGPPTQPWLEPDICETLRALTEKAVIVAPIGFLSDHMEVMYDLDYEAQHLAQSLGIRMVRAGTVGTHPRFIQMVGDLIRERSVTEASGWPDVCPADCCPAPTSARP